MVIVVLASHGRNMGGLVVMSWWGVGFKHQLRGLLPMTIAPGQLTVFFQRFSNNLTSASGAMPNRPRARIVARTETFAAPWTIGPPQQGHNIDVVAGVMLREWRMC